MEIAGGHSKLRNFSCEPHHYKEASLVAKRGIQKDRSWRTATTAESSTAKPMPSPRITTQSLKKMLRKEHVWNHKRHEQHATISGKYLPQPLCPEVQRHHPFLSMSLSQFIQAHECLEDTLSVPRSLLSLSKDSTATSNRRRRMEETGAPPAGDAASIHSDSTLTNSLASAARRRRRRRPLSVPNWRSDPIPVPTEITVILEPGHVILSPKEEQARRERLVEYSKRYHHEKSTKPHEKRRSHKNHKTMRENKSFKQSRSTMNCPNEQRNRAKTKRREIIKSKQSESTTNSPNEQRHHTDDTTESRDNISRSAKSTVKNSPKERCNHKDNKSQENNQSNKQSNVANTPFKVDDYSKSKSSRTSLPLQPPSTPDWVIQKQRRLEQECQDLIMEIQGLQVEMRMMTKHKRRQRDDAESGRKHQG